jgi:hypothetical protein
VRFTSSLSSRSELLHLSHSGKGFYYGVEVLLLAVQVSQPAVASGLEVVATASEANYALLEILGATQGFEYYSSTTIDDLVDIFEKAIS